MPVERGARVEGLSPQCIPQQYKGNQLISDAKLADGMISGPVRGFYKPGRGKACCMQAQCRLSEFMVFLCWVHLHLTPLTKPTYKQEKPVKAGPAGDARRSDALLQRLERRFQRLGGHSNQVLKSI